MNQLDASEIVIGLCMSGKINPSHVSPGILSSPYDQALKILIDGGGMPQVISTIGVEPTMSARQAADSVDPNDNWLEVLSIAASREELAFELEREVKRLKKGHDPDSGAVLGAYNRYSDKQIHYVSLDKIDPEAGIWTPADYEPFDLYMGGLPKAGLTIIGAPPGIGKTALLMRILANKAKRKKYTLLYTLEMTVQQICFRMVQSMGVSEEDRKYIISTDMMMNMDRLYAEASQLTAKYPLDVIGIDFADLLNQRDADESSYAYIYRRSADLAKSTGVPVILVAALNRQTYTGGMPKINHLRYSGMAEYMGTMIVLLYNPGASLVDSGKSSSLPEIPGLGYLIFGKSKFGYRQGGMGAAAVEWDIDKGIWDEEPQGWYPLGNS